MILLGILSAASVVAATLIVASVASKSLDLTRGSRPTKGAQREASHQQRKDGRFRHAGENDLAGNAAALRGCRDGLLSSEHGG